MWDKAATVERFMGPALANRAVPAKMLLDTLAFESTAADTDNPVNMLNPFVGQAITREQALHLYTNSGPYYTFEESKKVSIEVGRFADMVVLSADYLTVTDEQIKEIVSLKTIVNDQVD